MAVEKKAAPPKQEKETPIVLPPMRIEVMRMSLVGDSPLISHAWSAKAKQMMLDKQMKKPRGAKEAKDPQECYRESLYLYNGYGFDEALKRAAKGEAAFAFPSVAFKAAAVDACSHVDGVTKVKARGAFHIVGDMVALKGEPRMRQDMVRLQGIGSPADIRFRGEFPEWSTEFEVRFNANVLSAGEIVNLFNTAGFAIGVGDWRPERNGSFGMFHVA